MNGQSAVIQNSLGSVFVTELSTETLLPMAAAHCRLLTNKVVSQITDNHSVTLLDTKYQLKVIHTISLDYRGIVSTPVQF